MSGRVPRAGLSAVMLALGLAAVATPTAAQVSVTSVLRGEVRDSAGAPVTDAELLFRDQADGRVVAGTRTDAAGRYVLVALPPGGPYELVVERLGYAPVRRAGLRLAAGESRRLDIVLGSRPMELAGLRVVAAPDLVFSGSRTGAVTVLVEEDLDELPTVDRALTAFAVLSPWVAADGDAFSVAGQNSRYNAVRVDGAIAQDLFGLSPSGVPGGQANAKPLPLDAVRQYSVLVAPYDVRQSGFTGGLLDAVTREGGDRWAATAHGYVRGEVFSRRYDDTRVRSDALGTVETFSTELVGATASGPLGGARLFMAAEYERRRRPVPGFNVGEADPVRTGLVPDSVTRVREILAARGMEPGGPAGYTLHNPLGNLFARLDVPIGERHGLTVRYNGIAADEDLPPNRLGFDPYQLGSGGTRLESRTHGLMTRFASRLGEATTHEVVLNVQRTGDRTRATDDPQVEVRVRGRQDGSFLTRRLQAGAPPLAHADRLDQTVVQLVDNVSHAAGAHLWTAGVEGTWVGVRRRFLPASRGIWRFDSIGALEADSASSYERLVLADGADPDVRFSTLQIAGYIQDEWSVADGLAVTAGLRLDVPLHLDLPAHNPEAAAVTGVATDRLPATGVMVSPRLGISWSPKLERRTQLRGGVGVFTAPAPLTWLADVYAHTGLRTGLLVCDGATAPGLAPAAPPAECANGSAPMERRITYFDRAFRHPQDLRASLAVDRELPWGFVGSVEAIFTRSLHQPALEDHNLPSAIERPYDPAEGFPTSIGPRDLYGVPLLIPDRFGPLDPDRRWGAYSHVIRVGDRSRNAALAVAAELRRRFADRVNLRLAYTYTQAVDIRSLRYRSAALNYGLTPVRGDPTDPEPRPSSFARPHRVVGSVRARLLDWAGGLDVAALYVGRSGLPYSYVYATDMNGDGFPGPGVLADAYNDLFYLPTGLADVPATLSSQRLVFELLNMEECLHGSGGFISARNQCRAPWSNRLDLRVAQRLELPFADLRLTADIMNVLNLLNADWGLVHTAPPVVPILEINERAGCPGRDCFIFNEVSGHYIGPRRLDPETGDPKADLPYTPLLPESLWRGQLGVRIVFQ